MFLVDSSVWIDFFKARDTAQTRFLKQHLTARRIVVADLVLAEVLQGTRDEQTFEHVRRLLLARPIITVCDAGIAVRAARNYRDLRSRGITVRSTIDVLIATRCIADNRILLHNDRDFEPFVEHLGLRSALDQSF